MNEAYKKFDLTGKTAYVTGGGTGLGYYMSRGLLRSGAKVMIAARREDVLKDAAAKLTEESGGNEVLYSALDLSDRNSIADSSNHAIKTLGGVDIFIGNAAQECLEMLDDIKDETIDHMLQLNVAANISLFRTFLPHMRTKKWGRVIFSSSVTSHRATAQEGASAYITVKGALNAFARVSAAEVGRDGITVNSLIIGLHLTDIIKGIVADLNQQQPGMGDGFINDYSSMTALGHPGDCQDIEGVIQLLASEAGRYMTGGEIAIDGGMGIMGKPNPVN